MQSTPVSVTLAISVTLMGLPFKNRTSCTRETVLATVTFAIVSYIANRPGMVSSHVEICIADIARSGYADLGGLPYEQCDDLDL